MDGVHGRISELAAVIREGAVGDRAKRAEPVTGDVHTKSAPVASALAGHTPVSALVWNSSRAKVQRATTSASAPVAGSRRRTDHDAARLGW